LGLVGAALGVLALVLPFRYGDSPLKVLWGAWHGNIFVLPYAGLAAAGLLAVPIAAWQLQRLSSSPPWNFQIALAYIFSTSAMLPALGLSAWVAVVAFLEPNADARWWFVTLYWFVVLLSCWSLAACNALLLARNLKRRVARDVTAEVFLLGGYLPNAVLAFCVFPGVLDGWSIGAYVVLATCIAYAAKGAALLRSLKTAPQ
jgi:hypothetical protein